MKVFVYRNLIGSNWSIMKNGIVVDHSKELTLKNCEFLVRKSGRNRVIKEKVKNVHAFVVGDILVKGIIEPKSGIGQKISYDPYKNMNFKNMDLDRDIFRAKTVCFYRNSIVKAWE